MSPSWQDDAIDEGPSDEDVERFSDESAYCTACGATISDLATICPTCGASMPDGPSVHPPIVRDAQHRATVIVIVLVLLAFLGFFGVRSLF